MQFLSGFIDACFQRSQTNPTVKTVNAINKILRRGSCSLLRYLSDTHVIFRRTATDADVRRLEVFLTKYRKHVLIIRWHNCVPNAGMVLVQALSH